MKAEYATLSGIWPLPHLLSKYLWRHLAPFFNNPTGLLLPCFFNSISKCWHIYWTIFGRPSSLYLQGSRYKYMKATGQPSTYKTWQTSRVLRKLQLAILLTAKEHRVENNSGHKKTLAVTEAPLLNSQLNSGKFNLFLTHFSYSSDLWYEIGLRMNFEKINKQTNLYKLKQNFF